MVLPLPHESLFYEVMWRAWARRCRYPLPWWLQQTFSHWVEDFDKGLFETKQAALASNALYRYWTMVGVKDAHQEALVGQAGEVEPVYERYTTSFFVLDADGGLHMPQWLDTANGSPALEQHRQDGYLPVINTVYRPSSAIQVNQRTFGTTIGARQRSIVLNRLAVTATGSPGTTAGWLGVAVTAIRPSGFVRHDKGGRYGPDSRLSFLRYLPAEQRVETNSRPGPVFDTAPTAFGLYGNPHGSQDPERYLDDNPFVDLASGRPLNGVDTAYDDYGGLCTAAFLWPFDVAAGDLHLDMRLPVDDFRGPTDFTELRAPAAADLEAANLAFWQTKLNGSGLRANLPPVMAHLSELYRSCRADLLILSDGGAIHPGPTIYDEFWVRDSAVEGIACALAGDAGLAGTQFGQHYLRIFNTGPGEIGPVKEYGFFGGVHERTDHEWDANGEALWAFGRFDRIQGPSTAFGAKVYAPYVADGARWIRDNRPGGFGLLPSGWSAEHLGDKNKPHYWDDLWAVAGLYEAARLAERLGRSEVGELWTAFDDMKTATADSIRWVLDQQAAQGHWETFIPTGPADVGALNSTIIGALCYFHPTRLYHGAKLGSDVDRAFRLTLETIWARFVRGGFRHDEAWHAYGPYLTLQLAHAFLLVGDVDRMDACLAWAVDNAAFARVLRDSGPELWQVAQGAWNEQHTYAIADQLINVPNRSWYMGDIPHGWAAAEFTMLVRDILFFEAGEDDDPHIYLAPGVQPHWLRGDGGRSLDVSDAPTVFGHSFGYSLRHHESAARISIDIPTPLPGLRYVYPCRLGEIKSATVDGNPASTAGGHVLAPAGTRHVEVNYS